jgi:carbamoyl-phosphate synthase large subunit
MASHNLLAIKKMIDLLKKLLQAMKRIGLKTPPSGTCSTMEEAMAVAHEIGRFPLIIRPAFTLGGTGGGIAYNVDEFKDIVKGGLDASMTSQVRPRERDSIAI